MKMKKLLLVILALVMCFTLVACGEENHDENNAAIQAKVDQAEALVEEVISLYVDNGEGEGEARQAQFDTLRGQIDKVKADHQEILDGGGYDDDTAAQMAAVIDTAIAKYEELLATLNAALESMEEEPVDEESVEEEE